VDNPPKNNENWLVLGNPMQEFANFVSKEISDCQKIFTLLDAQGRLIRQNKFNGGQSFDFHRNGISTGVYFFNIKVEKGNSFTGKIILTD
jgi:hypothetical protein